MAVQPDKRDHPLISAYSGSTVYSKDVKEYDAYQVFKGWNEETKQYETQSLEGKVTKILYKNPPERSILEIFKNYEQALKQKEVTILYQCDQAKMECKNTYVGASIRQQFGIYGIGNKEGRYIFARLDQENQTAYIVLSVGLNNTDIHIIEVKKMETGKVALNMQVLTDNLEKQGYVILEGIYFDTDKTDIKSESKPALDEIAKLLKSKEGLKLFVVGHTDTQGALSYNMTLSQGRANAVVKALVTDYGISGDRLEGHGVGPLSPVASNIQEAGRSKNRRVVLVAR